MVSKPRLALVMLLLLVVGGGMIALVVWVLEMHGFLASFIPLGAVLAVGSLVQRSGVLYKKSKD